jgi:hypothetical protein
VHAHLERGLGAAQAAQRLAQDGRNELRGALANRRERGDAENMNARTASVTWHLDPIAQVTQRATDALVRELGVVDAIRFLGQFRQVAVTTPRSARLSLRTLLFKNLLPGLRPSARGRTPTDCCLAGPRTHTPGHYA